MDIDNRCFGLIFFVSLAVPCQALTCFEFCGGLFLDFFLAIQFGGDILNISLIVSLGGLTNSSSLFWGTSLRSF